MDKLNKIKESRYLKMIFGELWCARAIVPLKQQGLVII
jgi:hypothetical protein